MVKVIFILFLFMSKKESVSSKRIQDFYKKKLKVVFVGKY